MRAVVRPAFWPGPECRRISCREPDCGNVRRGWSCSFPPRRSGAWDRDRAGRKCRRWMPRPPASLRGFAGSTPEPRRRPLSNAPAWCRSIRRRCAHRSPERNACDTGPVPAGFKLVDGVPAFVLRQAGVGEHGNLLCRIQPKVADGVVHLDSARWRNSSPMMSTSKGSSAVSAAPISVPSSIVPVASQRHLDSHGQSLACFAHRVFERLPMRGLRLQQVLRTFRSATRPRRLRSTREACSS